MSDQSVRSLAHRVVARLPVDVLPRRYWTPIPHDIPEATWARRSPLGGVTLDLEEQAELLADLRPLMLPGTDPLTASSWYGGADAQLLVGMIRYLEPARVVELGSGNSTRLIQHAIRTDRLDTTHTVYDPFPGVTGPRPDHTIRPLSATDVPAGVFAALAPGDVLFVDTTHTVKTGGDVNRIVLDILPTLRRGVWVHFHDIFLPYEYPREWVTEKRLYWAEQYLLQAFLAFNPAYEVRLAAYALAREGHLPGRPGAFWICRV